MICILSYRNAYRDCDVRVYCPPIINKLPIGSLMITSVLFIDPEPLMRDLYHTFKSPGMFSFFSKPYHTVNPDRWAMIRCPSSQIVIPSNKEAVRPLSRAQWAFSPSVAYVTTISVRLLGRE